MNSLNNAIPLLYRTANLNINHEALSCISHLIGSEIDWNLFTELTLAHRVAPLVYNTLITQKLSAPPQTLAALKSRADSNILTSLELARELTALIDILAAAEIDILPIKGPVLAQSIYKNLALRETGDIDILIRSEDKHRCYKTLLDSGYTLAAFPGGNVDNQMHVGHMVESKRTGHIEARSNRETLIELHHELGLSYLPFCLNNDELWKLAVTTEFAGRKIYKLPPLYELLHLIDHGSKHGWYFLSWLCDINEFMKQHQETLDWELLISESKRLNMLTKTSVALRLVKRQMGFMLPDSIAQYASGTEIENAAAKVEWIHQHILDGNSYEHYQHGFRCAVIDRKSDLNRYLALRAVTPTLADWKWVALPNAFTPLYFVLRPIRLAGILARSKVKVSKPAQPKS